MPEVRHDLTTCSLNYTIMAIGGKWKPFIVWYLHAALPDSCRYGELKRHIPWDISHKMFSQQLQELERDNIVVRTEYFEKPLRVEYSLTEQGKLLAPVILYMRDWGAAFGEKFGYEALVQRTHGALVDNCLYYGYDSESLKKKVQIKFEL